MKKQTHYVTHHVKWFFFVFVVLIVSFSQSANPAEVTIAWDANTETDLAGYKIYHGTASGDYSHSVDVGNTTQHTLTGLDEGVTYYIAATAYDEDSNESGFSNEVAHTVSVVDTDGDGIPDSIEDYSCTDSNNTDTDGDGISDGVEDSNHDGVVDYGETNPCNFDTDFDGIPDGWEVNNDLDPLSNDSLDDADFDRYSNLREYLSGTDPQDQFDLPSILSDYDHDNDVDGADLALFMDDFGRVDCDIELCEYDLDMDGDVDDTDLFLFSEDFGRIDYP